ncbi:diatom spindle kinesin 1 [Tothia fuscella]|uniref:Diatom spindle kinesin 1 n=1 Tax=Tothia fuscella TaxID=1048955 RepID=A0A9P4NNY6_9PEZI|nr:diatom spindle kinesin 1 [Tothia fuscella]
MNDFQLKNRDLYDRLLSEYKPGKTKSQGPSNIDRDDVDTIIGVRIRPILPREAEEGHVPGVCSRKDGAPIVDIHEFRQHVRRKPVLDTSSYTVDKVWGPEAPTHSLYNELVSPLVPFAWNGGIGTLFAYGQTGSGKTHTISELERMVAAELFGGKLEGDREIHFSAFELAGNTAFDLLQQRTQIKILEDAFGETQLLGIVEAQPKSASDLLSLIETSTSFRKTSPTTSNDVSSRTHAVCRLRIANPSNPSQGGEEGILFLIDLAGSEAASDISSHTAERMKETKEINGSLSTLKDCIRGRATLALATQAGNSAANLAAAKKAHVPFRHSALTKVLKHVFDPLSQRRCKMAVVACVCPSLANIAQGRTTLRYAEMLRVQAPKLGLVEYDSNLPATWDNIQTRAWIQKNSGSPPIDGALLAPHENGNQLIRLLEREFIARCQLTPDITSSRAHAFYEKLWTLHIDSRRGAKTAPSNSQTSDNKENEPEEPAPLIPFTERLRPGMFIRATRTHAGYEKKILTMLLCPEGSMLSSVSGAKVVRKVAPGKLLVWKRYICANVTPAALKGAFDVNVQKQIVVPVEDMDEEVKMEYDAATRYYFQSV